MRTQKTIVIGSETFEVMHSRKYPCTLKCYYSAESCNGMDLYHYYSNPSETKRSIYRSWKEWERNTVGVNTFGVSSANCNFFTIMATYHSGDVMGICYITHAHNRFYPVVINGRECL